MSISMCIENQDYICFGKEDAEELLHKIQYKQCINLLQQHTYKVLFGNSLTSLVDHCKFLSSIDPYDNRPYVSDDGYYYYYVAIPKVAIGELTLDNAIKADGALNPSRSNNMDNSFMQQIMQAKLLKAVLSDKEMDLEKLMLMQSFSYTGKIEISEVIKTKLLGKLLKEGDVDNMPLDKLMLVQALQSGNQIDISQILGIKMLEGILKEDDKESK